MYVNLLKDSQTEKKSIYHKTVCVYGISVEKIERTKESFCSLSIRI